MNNREKGLKLFETRNILERKKLKPLLFAIYYGAPYILLNGKLFVALDNGVYRYYIKEKVLRYTANSWYDDINTDNL